MEWNSKPWEALTRDEWHAMVRLRVDVFVVEQDCPYPDLDGKDLRAWHVGRRGARGQGSSCCGMCPNLGPWCELRRAQHWSCRHKKGPTR